MGSVGISFFLRVLYYFGIVNLQDIGGGEIFLSLILPLLLCSAFIVLFRVLRWNAPGIYAIIGSAVCILLLIWNFSTGDFWRILFSIFLYIVAAVLLLATAGGYLPLKEPATIAFVLILLFRVLLYSTGKSGLGEYICEFSSLFLILSLLALTRCFKPHEKRA